MPVEFIQTIFEEFKTQAMKVLETCRSKGEDFMTVAFVIKDNNLEALISLIFRDDDEKEHVLSKLGQFMAEHNSYQVVIAVDTYIRTSTDPEKMRYLYENWDTEKPTLYPETMRQDALVVHLIDFQNQDIFSVTPYKIVNGKVAFDKPLKNSQGDKLNGVIRETIGASFLKATVLNLTKKPAGLKMVTEAMATGDTEAIKHYIDTEFPNLKGVSYPEFQKG